MVKQAIDWISAAGIVWKIIAAIIAIAIAGGIAYGAACVKIQADATAAAVAREALEGRVDNLEKDRDKQYEEIVKMFEKLRIARERVHAAEKASTDEYRKEMRERLRDQESTTKTMEAILIRLENRVP